MSGSFPGWVTFDGHDTPNPWSGRTGSHGSNDPRRDPYEQVLNKTELAGLQYPGADTCHTAQWRFRLEDKLERKLSAFDYAILTGAMSKQDASDADELERWQRSDRGLYTMLLDLCSQSDKQGRAEHCRGCTSQPTHAAHMRVWSPASDSSTLKCWS